MKGVGNTGFCKESKSHDERRGKQMAATQTEKEKKAASWDQGRLGPGEAGTGDGTRMRSDEASGFMNSSRPARTAVNGAGSSYEESGHSLLGAAVKSQTPDTYISNTSL